MKKESRLVGWIEPTWVDLCRKGELSTPAAVYRIRRDTENLAALAGPFLIKYREANAVFPGWNTTTIGLDLARGNFQPLADLVNFSFFKLREIKQCPLLLFTLKVHDLLLCHYEVSCIPLMYVVSAKVFAD